jgi:hypothetical protein
MLKEPCLEILTGHDKKNCYSNESKSIFHSLMNDAPLFQSLPTAYETKYGTGEKCSMYSTAKYIDCMSIYFNNQYTYNVSGYPPPPHTHTHTFLVFQLHLENTNFTKVIHDKEEILDPELSEWKTYFSTIEHILAVRSSLKS